MTGCKPQSQRRRFDVRVWFEDGSSITCRNIDAGSHNWSRANAKRSAEVMARRFDRGGIRAVAIQRDHVMPCSIHGVDCETA